MSIELKIKSKHLGQEAKIIRFEEYKCKKFAKKAREKSQEIKADQAMDRMNNLFVHRITVVRNEARATFLARAFVRGAAYKKVENTCNPESRRVLEVAILPRIHSMANKYGNKTVTINEIEQWINE